MIDDRELSALVARRVMGWKTPSELGRCNECGWPVGARIELGCTPTMCSMVDRKGPRADEPALYATDAGLALEAAMKAAKGWAVEIQAIDPSDCRVQIRNLTVNSWPTGRSRKLARALCLAALRAAGVEIQGDEIEAAERQGE